MANNVNISPEQKAVNKAGLLYFWQGIKTKLAGKVDKVDGMGLSKNDFTDELKTKLEGVEAGANKTVVHNGLDSTSTTEALSAAQGKVLDDKIAAINLGMEDLGAGDMLKSVYDIDNDGKVDEAKHAESADSATNATNAAKAADADKLGGQLPSYYAKASDIPTVPTNVSAFENDAGYLTEHQSISHLLEKTGDATNVTATFSQASARENIASTEKLTTILGKIAKWFADMKTVAFTGSYNDLIDTPTISNDLTDALKANYDAAYQHSQATHAPVDAERNVAVVWQVNGVDQEVTAERKVNIAVPTTVAQLSDAGDYAKKADLTNVYVYMGSKASASALPTSGNEVGHVYNLEDTGMNVAWNGTGWDELGSIFSIEYITNADIDEILAS